MLEEAAANIGRYARVERIIGRSDKIEKPAHDTKIQYVKVNAR